MLVTILDVNPSWWRNHDANSKPEVSLLCHYILSVHYFIFSILNEIEGCLRNVELALTSNPSKLIDVIIQLSYGSIEADVDLQILSPEFIF